MAASIVITVNDAKARQAISRLISGIANIAPILDDVGESLTTSTKRRFEAGRSPDGRAWPVSIRAKKEGGKTLVDRGRLLASITYRASGNQLSIGSNVIYAAIHQFGGTIKAKNKPYLKFKIGNNFVRVKQVKIPARPFLGLDAQDRGEVREIIKDHLNAMVAP